MLVSTLLSSSTSSSGSFDGQLVITANSGLSGGGGLSGDSTTRIEVQKLIVNQDGDTSFDGTLSLGLSSSAPSYLHGSSYIPTGSSESNLLVFDKKGPGRLTLGGSNDFLTSWGGIFCISGSSCSGSSGSSSNSNYDSFLNFRWHSSDESRQRFGRFF